MSRSYELIRHRRRRTDGYGGMVLQSEEILILRHYRRRPSAIESGTFTNFDRPATITVRLPPRRGRTFISFQPSFRTSGNDRPRSLYHSSYLEDSTTLPTSSEFVDGHIIMNESNSRPDPRPRRHHGAMIMNDHTPSYIHTSRYHHRRHQRQRRCSEVEPREQAGLGDLSRETTPTGLDLITHVSSGNQETEICVICQAEYESDGLIGVLSCSHCFHVNCIRRWLQERNMCPICRAIPRGS